MHEILNTLLAAAEATSWIEWLAFFASIIYVILAARQHMACWSFGLLSSAAFVYLCITANLYLETGLQFFYIVMSVYGWVNWRKKEDTTTLRVSLYNFQKHAIILLCGAAITFLLGSLFSTYTNQASPYLDASITSFSLVATFLTAQKILENWIYWIIIDFSAAFLYGSRELYLSALLFLIFTAMAIYGFFSWRKAYKNESKLQHLAS